MSDILKKLDGLQRQLCGEGRFLSQSLVINAHDEIERLQGVINELAPYTDSIICYASTISEHDGNRVAKLLKDSVKPVEHEPRCFYWKTRQQGRTEYPYKEHWRDCNICIANDPTCTEDQNRCRHGEEGYCSRCDDGAGGG